MTTEIEKLLNRDKILKALDEEIKPLILVYLVYKTIEANPSCTDNKLSWCLSNLTPKITKQDVIDTISILKDKSGLNGVKTWHVGTTCHLHPVKTFDLTQYENLYPYLLSFVPPDIKTANDKNSEATVDETL